MFGYDPLIYQIGRGALEATGIGFPLQQGDVAVRCNFCTLDSSGLICDRRAGRISSDESAAIVNGLRNIKVEGAEVFVEPVKEHRFVAIFRGPDLGDQVGDTDPQAVGVPPLQPIGRDRNSENTAVIASEFLSQARSILLKESKANFLTMRGFALKPSMPSFEDVYLLNAAAIAVYPMYKGLARLVGMQNIGSAVTLSDQVDVLISEWRNFDFFFIHFKYTDSTGEDGLFDEKVRRLEELDRVLPRIDCLSPDVLIITGDHSTPSALKSHSWHPVPTLLVSKFCRPDHHVQFSESTCVTGGLGQFEAKYLMLLALGNAQRLGKFGA